MAALQETFVTCDDHIVLKMPKINASRGGSCITVSSEEAVGIREKTSRSNVILRVPQPRQHVGVTKHNAPVGLATSKSLSLLCDAGWCYQ